MHKSIEEISFDAISLYPECNWNEILLLIFERACSNDNYSLAKKIYKKIEIEAIRTNNPWIFKLFIENEIYHEDLRKIEVLNHAEIMAMDIFLSKSKALDRKYKKMQIEFKISNPMFQFRSRSQLKLCACCHDYVLSCDEIQNFPLINNTEYIKSKFYTALSQPEKHKRTFLITRLLEEYSEKNPDEILFFKLWIEAEEFGTHVSPNTFIELLGEKILDKCYFKSLLTIINFRHPVHDNFIDDVIELLLIKKNYQMAYYLNAKLSSPYFRLFYTVGSMLNSDDHYARDNETMINLLDQVLASIRHEKVKNK